MIIGTCSICGGPVESPDAWYSIIPPVPQCRACGAVVKATHGPVIEMTPISVPTIQTPTTGTKHQPGPWTHAAKGEGEGR